ncbi:MAG: peptidylprolyl isomerase [Alphaproteobacteria bacterium]|nr:MAG: peptidylprolyl isomerase [Alphaproteobacteria bacterium]
MKLVHSIALVLVAVIALAIGYYAGTQTKGTPVAEMVGSVTGEQSDADMTKDESRVLATVNGESLTEKDVEELYQSLPPQYRQAPIAFIKAQLLEQLISMEVIAQAAEKEKMEDQPEFQARLDNVKTQLMQEYYLKAKLKELVTDDKIKTEYDKFAADFKSQEEVHARHILLKTEKEANDMIKLLDEGKDFQDLAKQYSTGPSAKSGGDLGYFTKDRMVPEFADAAFAMNKGEYSKKPIKTQFGWHVIKVEDKRETKAPSFEEKKAEIQNKLTNDTVEKLVEDLKKAAKIEIIKPEKDEKADDAAKADESKDKDGDADAKEGDGNEEKKD